MDYINRQISEVILQANRYYPVTIITGPRQTGKTTLARHLFADYNFVNLEDIATRNRAVDDINSFLDSLGEKAIIDEVQNYPPIMSSIQARVDADKSLRYILTGSNNFSLLHNSMQSLAGRASLFTVLPFSFSELSDKYLDISTSQLMLRGFYPGTIADDIPPEIFYRNYYATYIERDIRSLFQIQHLDKFQLFLRLCASRAGNELNMASIAVEAGVSAPTIASWISLLKASYIIYTLPPYYANISKRLTKTPKIYFYDSGLLCYLLGIENFSQLDTHPLRGFIFENIAVTELLKNRYNQAKDPNLYFYRENSGREVDIVQTNPDGLHIYEIKAGKTFQPDFTKNLKYLASLLPDVKNSTVIYDGETHGTDLINLRAL
ncbi:MAG: ATP-binding protein [Muribaculaceae bacterium]|nr:ATP-binding protein [Muribaculaceae bacterium]